MSNTTRVRFAPSPTGSLHIGGLRTALYDYLYAKRQKGKFILRIEDTDRNRYQEEAIHNLISSLEDMGLEIDEGPEQGGDYGPYIQSERLDIYQKHIKTLLDNGTAYYCFCSKERLDKIREEQKAKKETPKYDGKCKNLSKEEVQKRIDAGENYVIRLAMPKDTDFIFGDAVRGKITINSDTVDDQVLMKSDGFPTYHLAAVVDDHLMEISHVIRGEEWITSTPKHLFLYESFGWKPPKFVHLPLILNTDKKKLSKRHGDFSVKAVMKKGYLKDAIINFCTLLGWHPKSDKDIFSIKDTIKEFSFKKVNKSGAIFDEDKLNFLNGWYIRNLDIKILLKEAKPYFEKAGYKFNDDKKLINILEVTRDYANTLVELVEESKAYIEDLKFSENDIQILKTEDSKTVFNGFYEEVSKLEKLNIKELNQIVKDNYKSLGVKGKNFYHPIRLVLFGKTSGPEVPQLIKALGKEKTLARLQNGLDL